jgi:exoribonuclease-2
MIQEKALVLYKTRPAVITDREGDKINISVPAGDKLKVREKDIETLHPGPCVLGDLAEAPPEGDARGAWELLEDAGPVPLKELAELVYGDFTPRTAWAAYGLLADGLYFSGDIKGIKARPGAEVEAGEKKRNEKQKETGERAAFLERLKAALKPNPSLPSSLAPGDHHFLQDVEALALGKTAKSRTLKELGWNETPEDAHMMLLAAGIWTVWQNPYPSRFGVSLASPKTFCGEAPDEDRTDLTHLKAYAIDNAWSDDPDDAVSLEGPDARGNFTLYVHVADPGSSILPGSPDDIEARGRGATLYLPEGKSAMLAEEAVSVFALGLSPGGICPALSFKMTLTPGCAIAETGIIRSKVKVSRLCYRDADGLADGELAAFFALSEKNTGRRLDTGAVLIDMPDVRIKVGLGENAGLNSVNIEPVPQYKSAGMVRECMILAGEGAARWAVRNNVPFPFISQEEGELPGLRPDGLAGAFQLRRCMRPRILSSKPGVHWGLGLDEYTQVTSPLRRYTDLLCHQQIRSFLQGRPLLSAEEILLRVSAAEAAAASASRAEKASRRHWTCVYLLDKKGSEWEGIVLERKGIRGTVIIPALGLETQLNLKGGESPNDKITLVAGAVNISRGEITFISV